VHYSQDWAEVSNTPFASFKGTSSEGGMRVPFIVNYPEHIKPGSVTDQFAYATDFLPTVLDIAGIALPTASTLGGAQRLPPTGTSMLPFLEGRSPTIHGSGDSIGFEGTGADALFKGDYKILRNTAPAGDDHWHLYNMRQDPTEANDLALDQPLVFKAMLTAYERYMHDNGVIKPAAGYDPLGQLLKNNWPVLVRQMAGVLSIAALGLLALIVACMVGLRHWIAKGTPQPS